ncbi:MAG: hypothetical protein RL141_280 [Candidatus Parcubacteria bacterium]
MFASYGVRCELIRELVIACFPQTVPLTKQVAMHGIDLPSAVNVALLTTGVVARKYCSRYEIPARVKVCKINLAAFCSFARCRSGIFTRAWIKPIMLNRCFIEEKKWGHLMAAPDT